MNHPVVYLTLATLVIVALVGFWQLASVKRSKANRNEPDGQVAAPGEHVTSLTRGPMGPKPGTVPPSRQ